MCHISGHTFFPLIPWPPGALLRASGNTHHCTILPGLCPTRSGLENGNSGKHLPLFVGFAANHPDHPARCCSNPSILQARPCRRHRIESCAVLKLNAVYSWNISDENHNKASRAIDQKTTFQSAKFFHSFALLFWKHISEENNFHFTMKQNTPKIKPLRKYGMRIIARLNFGNLSFNVSRMLLEAVDS